MDVSPGAWLPELEMEDHHDFMNQRVPYSELVDSFSSQSIKGYQHMITRNQPIQAAINNGDLIKQEISFKAARASSFVPICGSSSNSNFTISFGEQNAPTDINHDALKSEEEMSLNELIGSIDIPRRVGSTRRNHRQAQEHVLAERKRREKLTQRFISLSALLPEVKKMDKAMVLKDASNYIKELQNRVKELEEASFTGKNVFHNSKRRSKYYDGNEDVAYSFKESTNSLPSSTTYYDPGIRARISGNNVLVRIYCRENSTLALKALIEMERLHFIIICNSVLPVSKTSALITIIAQISEEFVMTAMDLVKYLKSSLSSFL